MGRAHRQRAAVRRRPSPTRRRAGDRVVAYAPNIPETLVAFLAAASLGAIWSSCRARVRRPLGDRPLRPDRADRARRGRRLPLRRQGRSTARDHVAEIVAALPSLRHVVHVPYLDRRRRRLRRPATARSGTRGTTARRGDDPASSWRRSRRCPPTTRSTCCSARARPGCRRRSSTATAASSPSTSRCSTFHQDLGPGDRFFWFTTTGWMMWNYCVSGLLVGSTVVLFDGDPGSPDLDDAVATSPRDTGTTVFGRVGTVPDGVPQGRPDAASTRRAALGRLDRVAAAGRRVPLGRRHGRRAGVVDLRRHRRRARRSSARRRCRRCGPARSADGCSAARSRRSRPTATVVPAGRHRRARHHQADAVDAGRVLGRRRRHRSTGPPTSRTSPACGATATG